MGRIGKRRKGFKDFSRWKCISISAFLDFLAFEFRGTYVIPAFVDTAAIRFKDPRIFRN